MRHILWRRCWPWAATGRRRCISWWVWSRRWVARRRFSRRISASTSGSRTSSGPRSSLASILHAAGSRRSKPPATPGGFGICKRGGGVTRLTIGLALFLALVCSANAFAQRTTIDPYTTNLGLRYDFFSHSGDANSFVGFNADVTRMLGGFTKGGGWGAGGGIDIEKFESSTLKEFEAYVTAQAAASGQKQLSPFGRFGIGVNTDE